MRRIIWVIVPLLLLGGVVFVRHQNETNIRLQVVVDYLEMTKVMSSFMMETAMSPQVTRPSLFSLEVLYRQNQSFQKKYRAHGRMRLYAHNRLEDFLASVDGTVQNYFRLVRINKESQPSQWQSQVRRLDQFFFHNAVYCVMSIGKDKRHLAISSSQRHALRRVFWGAYGGLLMQYASRSARPPFVANLFLIAESLERRQPAGFLR